MSTADRQPGPSLRGDFVVNLAGYIGYAAAQWAMLLVLVRLGSPAMVGEYSLALAIGAPVIMFTNLRLAYLLASDAARSRPFSDYFSLRMVANALAMLAIMVWATFVGYRGDKWLVTVLVGLAKVAEASSDVVFAYLGMRLRFRAIAASIVIRGWITVLIMFLLRMFDVPLIGIALALAIWWWIAFWQIDIRLMSAAARDDDTATAPQFGLLGLLRAFRLDKAMLQLAWQAVPLGIVALALSLNASVPRLMIARTLGADTVGYFSALAYVMVAGRMVAVALGTPALPRLGRFAADGDRAAFARTVGLLVVFGFALGAVGVITSLLVGAEALMIVYGADYASYAPVMTWLLVASGLGYSATFLEDSLVAMRRLRAQATLLVLTLATITIGCWVLIPRFGLRGAAWALVFGACIELLGAAGLFGLSFRTWARQGSIVPARMPATEGAPMRP
jgi:O-antigen/teichoic acid export membrane protein